MHTHSSKNGGLSNSYKHQGSSKQHTIQSSGNQVNHGESHSVLQGHIKTEESHSHSHHSHEEEEEEHACSGAEEEESHSHASSHEESH